MPIIMIVVLTVMGCLSAANAQTLTHRYLFATDASDSVGSMTLSYTTAATKTAGNHEQPLFGQSSVPTGSLVGTSVGLGMNKAGSKTSGFQSATTGLLDLAGDGAISLWLNWTASQANPSYVFAIVNGGNSMQLLFSSADTLRLGSTGGTNITAAASSYGENVWHNVVVNWNSTTLLAQFYLDGLYVGDITLASSLAANTEFRLGNFNPMNGSATSWSVDNQYVGSMCDLQIYDSTLSSAQAASLYANPGMTVVPEPSALSYASLIATLLIVMRKRRPIRYSTDPI